MSVLYSCLHISFLSSWWMNCTLNLLRKAASQTPRDRPLCVDERGILKSDIFFGENCAKLGRNIRQRTVTLSSSDSNAARYSSFFAIVLIIFPVMARCPRPADEVLSRRDLAAFQRRLSIV